MRNSILLLVFEFDPSHAPKMWFQKLPQNKIDKNLTSVYKIKRDIDFGLKLYEELDSVTGFLI